MLQRFKLVLINMSLVILLFILTISYVSASASISMPSDNRHLTYEPGLEASWNFVVGGSESVEVYLRGPLTEYAELIDPDPMGGRRSVTVKLVSPDEVEPGVHYLYIDAKEHRDVGFMGGVAVASVPMSLTKYSETPYVKAKIVDILASEGETAEVSIELESLSKVTTYDIRAKFNILDENIESENLLLPALGSLETKVVTVKIPIADLRPGRYSLASEISYEESVDNQKFNQDFLVGTLNLKLIKQPNKLSLGQINKVSFVLYNEWNAAFKDAEPIIRIPGLNIDEQSPARTIGAFTTQGFNYYLEVPEDADLGTYEGTIYLKTGDKRKDFITVPFKIEVVEFDETTQVVEEKPSSMTFNPLLIAYVLVIILVIINVILLFRKKE